MRASETLWGKLQRHYPKRLRVGSRVTLVDSYEHPVNTVWRVEEITRRRVRIGVVTVTVRVFTLRRRAAYVDAVPFPVLALSNRFVKWTEQAERRRYRKECDRLASVENELTQLIDRLDEIHRLKCKNIGNIEIGER